MSTAVIARFMRLKELKAAVPGWGMSIWELECRGRRDHTALPLVEETPEPSSTEQERPASVETTERPRTAGAPEDDRPSTPLSSRSKKKSPERNKKPKTPLSSKRPEGGSEEERPKTPQSRPKTADKD